MSKSGFVIKVCSDIRHGLFVVEERALFLNTKNLHFSVWILGKCYAELVRNVKGSAAMESWINTVLKGYTIIKWLLI